MGKIANRQIGVFLACVTRSWPVLLDRELYLPREWANDPARRREAGMPAKARCVPKPTLGKQLLERAFAAGVQAAWVTADSIYGRDAAVRAGGGELQPPNCSVCVSMVRMELKLPAQAPGCMTSSALKQSSNMLPAAMFGVVPCSNDCIVASPRVWTGSHHGAVFAEERVAATHGIAQWMKVGGEG